MERPCTGGWQRFIARFPDTSKPVSLQELVDAGTPYDDIVWALQCSRKEHFPELLEALFRTHRDLYAAIKSCSSPNTIGYMVWVCLPRNLHKQYITSLLQLENNS